MKFTPLHLSGACAIELEKFEDNRGFFARGWCQKEFEAQGLPARVVQTNISYNKKKGTLRGMHFQKAPFEETKLVRCTRGALYDVIIDLRPHSPTFKRWLGVELSANNYKMILVPEGFAHGFETLEDDTEAYYQVSQFYTPSAEGGVRFDDPAFKINWPLAIQVISDRDRNWPTFASA
jgi:dTDP-4-dehydrorhamnose 3,5-epimerase